MSAQMFRFAMLAWAGVLGSTSPASAQAFFFSTGSPDGLMATASRPASGGLIGIETADDFILTDETLLTGGTFTGLLPGSSSNVQNVVVEVYRIFPLDSATPASGHVPSRTNSPSDLALVSRDATAGDLTFSTATINPSFSAANSVINGVFPLPNVFTGGEGPVAGSETLFTFNFVTPIDLLAGHYFLVPQVQLSSGNFLWLSAPRVPGPDPDLQTWIRNDDLAPDWLRIGTDITQQGPFNAAFSLHGSGVPEPASWTMMLAGFLMLGWSLRQNRRHPVSLR